MGHGPLPIIAMSESSVLSINRVLLYIALKYTLVYMHQTIPLLSYVRLLSGPICTLEGHGQGALEITTPLGKSALPLGTRSLLEILNGAGILDQSRLREGSVH